MVSVSPAWQVYVTGFFNFLTCLQCVSSDKRHCFDLPSASLILRQNGCIFCGRATRTFSSASKKQIFVRVISAKLAITSCNFCLFKTIFIVTPICFYIRAKARYSYYIRFVRFCQENKKEKLFSEKKKMLLFFSFIFLYRGRQRGISYQNCFSTFLAGWCGCCLCILVSRPPRYCWCGVCAGTVAAFHRYHGSLLRGRHSAASHPGQTAICRKLKIKIQKRG